MSFCFSCDSLVVLTAIWLTLVIVAIMWFYSLKALLYRVMNSHTKAPIVHKIRTHLQWSLSLQENVKQD